MAKVVSARAADQPTAAIGTDVIYRKLFDSFNPGQDGRISHWEVLTRLQRSGLQPDDPRIAEALAGLKAADGAPRQIGFQQFKALAKHNSSLIRRAVEGNLAVPDFSALTSDIDRMYAELIPVRSGAVADYIPQLARVNPEQLAIAVCTVDGQRFSVGDATTMFCLQSVSKMVSYCLALDEHGTEAVHRARGPGAVRPVIQRAGAEPEGPTAQPDGQRRGDHDRLADPARSGHRRPVRSCGRDLAAADRRRPDRVQQRRLPVRTADRRPELRPGLLDAGKRRVPARHRPDPTLEFYFQGCSIEVDAQMLAVAAASLANAGVCPLTEDPVFSPGTVQSCLSLMSSCGMYDFSGEFAFTIGLPAKSGVSGAVMLVIPGLMGICVWSPRLDEHGNSVRGIEFCRKLAAAYNVHVFDSLHAGRGRADKRDPRRKKNQTQIEGVVALTWAASQGDLDEVRALLAAGVEPGTADYDGRTPLHLAAAEGQLDVVRYLLAAGARPQPADRWGGTPLSDAEGNGHTHVAELIRQAAQPAERKVAI